MESSPWQHQRYLSVLPPDHQVPEHKFYNSHKLNIQILQTHSHRYWSKKNKRLQKDYLVHFLSSRSYIHYIPYLPSWYPVWTSTAHTACTIACAVSTDGADHALIQLPLVHPWLAHHALFLLLLQLILQIFIHGCGHVLHTKGYTKKTQQLS